MTRRPAARVKPCRKRLRGGACYVSNHGKKALLEVCSVLSLSRGSARLGRYWRPRRGAVSLRSVFRESAADDLAAECIRELRFANWLRLFLTVLRITISDPSAMIETPEPFRPDLGASQT